MNTLLEQKREELERAEKYACWYLVKQPTDFDSLCYLVRFLQDYQDGGAVGRLKDDISRRIAQLSREKPELEISDNYRALRVAAVFGLLRLNGSQYETASATETFREITDRCGGVYERTECYQDIIQRQIEKIYVGSPVDEARDTVRRGFRLYPVMLLYKVLLELGRATGRYAVTMTEYRYLVATTRTYEGFLDTLLLIRLLREDPDAPAVFEQYREKFDNRMIQALKQLPTLCVERDQVALRPEWIRDAAEKVYRFEQGQAHSGEEAYTDFLGSHQPLLPEEPEETETAEPWTEAEEERAPDRVTGGGNILLYGVPGSGKSWLIAREYCAEEGRMERLVFHPDYTYGDFVGQILPRLREGRVDYAFQPGPFTRLLRRAEEDPAHGYFLVIEELNRGNAPAIFGEIFQLLDRDEAGNSIYGITQAELAQAVYGDGGRKVRIPSNMTILATMNTSDQNVFPMDTAFQRRWEMRLVENSFAGHPYADEPILDTGVTWRQFCQVVNRVIAERAGLLSSEDKRLGVYFVRREELRCDGASGGPEAPEAAGLRAGRQSGRFGEKVLKYLWDDACKLSREDLFDTETFSTLEEVLRRFSGADSACASGADRLAVFRGEIVSALLRRTEQDG